VTVIGPEHEAPQARGDGASDAFTVSFGDPVERVYGLARLGVVPGSPPTRSGMGLLFDGTDPIAVRAEGAVSEDSPAGVALETVEPLRQWRVSFEDAFELDIHALTPPAALDPKDAVAKAGGMRGYEQLVRVRGTAGGRKIDCLGQRGHSWGSPDWSKIALTRTLSAWLDTETAVSLTAVRPSSAKHHADEAVSATVFLGGAPVSVAEPLVSTTFDGDGRQRHAGLELWLDDDGGFPYRAAGEVLCGTTLDLGRLRLDAAFFAWRAEGRTGVGRYDVLRRTDDV
jgi:hypothetical protein